MKLSELARFFPESQLVGGDVEVTSLAYDSRQIAPGALFVALRGAKSDGHQYLASAIERGAAAFVIDSDYAKTVSVPALIISDTRAIFPQLSAYFYGEPSRTLTVIGITGTNGKTTTTYMIESILRAQGWKTGLIGTVGALINNQPTPLERTTPESADLQRLFAEMREQSVSHVVMEVSSQGILAERTQNVAFNVGVFTNLTQDHLDAHGTMEAYFAQKLRLFTDYAAAYPEKAFAGIINADDPYGPRIGEALESAGRPVLRYGLTAPNLSLWADAIETRPNGTTFRAHYESPLGEKLSFPVALKMGGLFNIYNALAAIGAAFHCGASLEAIQNGLSALPGVPGRFEPIETEGRGFHVIVDYAHTPDGLENVLKSARALNPARLLCVFGCGGDRDTAKRPLMGKLSSDLADLTVITSDNPRTENPDAIIADILAGIDGGLLHSGITIEADRYEAIRKALCELARPGDLVVIAGKGHETTQTFADRTIDFDDRQVAREALASCP